MIKDKIILLGARTQVRVPDDESGSSILYNLVAPPPQNIHFVPGLSKMNPGYVRGSAEPDVHVHRHI